MKIFFAIAISIYLLFNSYVFVRIWQVIPAGFSYKLIYTILYILISLSFIVAMAGRNTLPLGFLKIIYAIGTIWLAYMMYFFLFFLITDVINLFNHWIHFLPENIATHFRQIQVYGSAVIITVMLIAGYYKFTHPLVNTYDIKIDKKAGERKELRIVGLSDIHLGLLVDKNRFSKYVDKVNALQPDIILIAGDVIDNSTRLLNAEHLEDEINRLQAPLGIYMCLGNHEYISGINNSLDFLKKTKINLLIDSVAQVDSAFWVIGRNDRFAGKNRRPLSGLVAEINPSEPIFLLDHQPFHLAEAENVGVDFQFSGHTHNGQLWPGNLIANRIYEVSHGYKQKNNLHVYVSSGLALWGPPFRIGTESEIAVFNIKFDIQ
ncbi:MAG: metallophosphoesterase [Dysgonamonadaceae bacterium]|jgi:predicted MPP superfamily phosphohydrolase|nr:metallophosphoesterase [Dysgonamonadaceae bacterium]